MKECHSVGASKWQETSQTEGVSALGDVI